MTPSKEVSFLDCEGGMAERLRKFDWRNHPLGPPETWPQSLKIVIRIMLTSRYAMWLGWGNEFFFFCNDAYLPTVGIKRDWVLGASARRVWAEIWPDIGPRAESVVKTGQATWDEGLLLFLERSGFTEETYHTFSYSPVPNDDGSVGGMLCVVTEETNRIIGERRLGTLRDVAAELDVVRTETQLFPALEAVLERNSKDTPFSLIYLTSESGDSVVLSSTSGIPRSSVMAPLKFEIDHTQAPWPAAEVLRKTGLVIVSDLAARFGPIPLGPWDKPAIEAVLAPLIQQGQDQPAGFFVAALNPYRPFDAAYKSFIELLTGQISAALSSVRAYESERKRAESLAALDRAKTTFFSNISHELRTPLTLMLGPIEDELRDGGAEKPGLQLAHRNSLRLLKLVNSLLDFSRIEAGRMEARYQPTDLGIYTAELASVFRSAIEKAGLRFTVHCEPLPEVAYVDREMWEKVVLNLISNAFKFTFEGAITVSVGIVEDFFELSVQDSGAGIPASALGNLFERFHRVRSTRSRSIEGTGIGLALVKELAGLHGGAVLVESVEGKGSTFRVRIKRGKEHLPAKQVDTTGRSSNGPSTTVAFVTEARRWAPEQDRELDELSARESEASAQNPSPKAGKARIVVADDNSDMREYVGRLLSPTYDVEIVQNGAQALDVARANSPDLLITDVMMPELDGFGLLQSIRQNPATRSLPVIMLSARAGEESKIEGLSSGANDYLIKPFGARELLARVSSQLELAALRREGEERVNRILESITDAFLVLDENWRFASLNDAAKKTLSPFLERPEDLLGRNHWEIFPATVGSPVERIYRQAAEEKVSGECENYYPPWNRWYSVRAFPVRNGGISVFFRDITDRKDSDRAREHLAAIIEASSEAIISLDLEGKILTWNPAAVQMFGFSAAEAIGQELSLFTPDEFRESQWENFRRVVGGEKLPRFEGVRKRKDGALLEVSIKVDAIRNADGDIVSIAGLITDISERKHRERLVAEQARLLDLSNDAIIVCELDDRINYWNRGAEAIYGWTFEEARGRVKGELLHTRYPKPLKEIHQELLRETRWEGELVQYCKDGRSIVVFSRWALDTANGSRAILKTNNDITAWKRAERSLKESEARFKQLANAMPQLVWSADPNGAVGYYNDRIHLYACDLLPDGGWDWKSMLHPDEMQNTIDAWDNAVRVQQQYQIEHRLKLKEGGWRWHLSRGIPVQDEAGGVIKWFGTATDIHELKLAQLELEQAKISLEETVAQRTAKLRESIGELEAFSYSVSHDMRAPLRAMQNFSRALLDDYREKLDDEGKDLLQRIEKGARRLDLLVQDVLAYSRVAKGEFQLHLVDIQSLVEETIQNFEFQTAKITIEKPLPKALGHEALLSQIFSNLIGNAIKFAQPNVPAQICIHAETREDVVKILIKDNGIGIDPAHFRRIFEIFGRVHPDKMYAGTGIGLAIVKKAVERLGGTVGVESEVGKGSLFWFTLAKSNA